MPVGSHNYLFFSASQGIDPLADVFISKIELGNFSINIEGLFCFVVGLIGAAEIISQLFCGVVIFNFIGIYGLIKNIDCIRVPAFKKETQTYFSQCRNLVTGVSLGILKERDCLITAFILEKTVAVFVFGG